MKERYDQINSLVQSIILRQEPITIIMPKHLAPFITSHAVIPKEFEGVSNPKPDFFIGDPKWHQVARQHAPGTN